MPVKRSRAGSSPALTEPSVPAAASTSQAKVMKTDAAVERSRSKFTFGSPVNAGECDHKLEIGEFLERCHYCKKRIAKDSEVFMYSILCAFCSVQCRDSQIDLDEKKPKYPKEKSVEGQK